MIGALIFASAALGTASPSSNSKTLQPAGEWMVNWGDANCVGGREFRDGDITRTLAIKMTPISKALRLFVVSPGSRVEPEQQSRSLSFDDDPPITVSMLVYGEKGTGIQSINLDEAQSVRMAAAKSVTIELSKGKRITLPIEKIGAVTRELEKCRVDLVKLWHHGPENAALLKSSASANLLRHFDWRDYPIQASRADISGSVFVVMLVDEQGKVADCTVEETSGVAVLDAQSCAILKVRAKFKPAIGLDGKPAKSTVAQRINWRMPSK